MTDKLQHECGIAFVRLLKPLEYYHYKYGNCLYGLQRLHLLMEKQRNRGQDGTGVVCVKVGMEPGEKYVARERSSEPFSIDFVFRNIYAEINKMQERHPKIINNIALMKKEMPFAGEIYMGHLRYGAYIGDNIENVHPVIRQNNWKTRNLILAGNFHLTNAESMFKILVELGQFPTAKTDTVTMLENMGHFLDRENQKLFDKFKKEQHENIRISELIAENLSIKNLLYESSKKWDGGYVICGIIGHGDAFIYRDPCGIRPAYYYCDDEVAVAASERPVIQTAFELDADQIKELTPGHAFIVKADGSTAEEEVQQPKEKKSCSFERIYFSRGSDRDIYKERKMLGELLVPDILKSIDYDIENTVFSYIPNTAETAFYGMVEGVESYLNTRKKESIIKAANNLTPELLDNIIDVKVRVEKVAIKDAKLRTFITQDKNRADMVGHVYDITYGTIKKGVDNLVIIDDSIVRGTTLKLSIIRILDRLEPKKIVFVSSSPQIRYPDCYGIDMSCLSEFVAFRAAITLLRERGKENIINEVYKKCKQEAEKPLSDMQNCVTAIYEPFTDNEISEQIAKMLSTSNLKAKIELIFQPIDNLHNACPNDTGDWYFTGNYPTHGGNKLVNQAFIDYIETNKT
jgi:amidophosphoribosyltransferase